MSFHILGVGWLNFLGDQVDKMVIGRVLGTSSLGIYSVASRVTTLMSDVLSRSVQLVALPTFAHLQDSAHRFRAAFFTGTRLSFAVTLPCFVFMGVNAEVIVGAVFGARWLACVPILQVLCVYAALQAAVACNSVCLQALGRSKDVLCVVGLGTLLQLPAIWAVVGHGMTWVAATFVARATLVLPLTLWLLRRALRTHMSREYFQSILPPAAACGGLAAVGWLGHLLSLPASVWGVAGLGIFSFGTYGVLLKLLGRRHFADLIRMAGLIKTRA